MLKTNLHAYIESVSENLRAVRAVTPYPFSSFGDGYVARLVTKYEGDAEYAVVYCRNPYGSHNLVLVSNGVAVHHGNWAVLEILFELAQFDRHAWRAFRKAVAFLTAKQELRKEKASLAHRLDRAYALLDRQERIHEGAMARAFQLAGIL